MALVVQPTRLDWAASFPRLITAAGAEAYVGPYDIIVICQPLTRGEEIVMSWVEGQDGAVLIEAAPLEDGRDVLILSRDHSRQDLDEALAESRRTLIDALRSSSRVSAASLLAPIAT